MISFFESDFKPHDKERRAEDLSNQDLDLEIQADKIKDA